MLLNPLAVGLKRGARGPLYRKPSIGRADSWVEAFKAAETLISEAKTIRPLGLAIDGQFP